MAIAKEAYRYFKCPPLEGNVHSTAKSALLKTFEITIIKSIHDLFIHFKDFPGVDLHGLIDHAIDLTVENAYID